MSLNLKTKIEDATRLSTPHKTALKKLRLETIEDLLFHFPTRYGDVATASYIENLEKGSTATLFGTISKLKTGKTFKGKIPKAEAIFTDETGQIKLMWFNQPYIAKMFDENNLVKIEGKISISKSDVKSILNPRIEKISKIPIGVGDSLFGNNENELHLFPVYKESKGITSNWFYHTLQKIFKADFFKDLKDPIPPEILKKYNLPSLKTALVWIHAPRKKDDALSARKRFAFEEIFYIQLSNKLAREKNNSMQTFQIDYPEKETAEFVGRYGFELTEAQKKSIATILEDLKSGRPMSRLLEGDVGSGKTAVAAAVVNAVVKTDVNQAADFDLKKRLEKATAGQKAADQGFGNLQVAYMVPTEILAKQHFENFLKYFEAKESSSGIKIGLLTGSTCKKFPSKVRTGEATSISKAQLSKWVENGEISIVIGTHALIQKNVKFKNLALVIIDEQHRFGTTQRQKLARKDDFLPHLLSMTATPIPRTLALTIYGDLDLTLLDQMPSGRKPIITEIILPSERKKIYEKVRAEIKAGRQAYVICPRINEPDPDKLKALNVKSVKSEAARLREEIFPELEIAELHSKMSAKEKEEIMSDFENGKTNILVSTSVIEVGVNVPNATIILIEGAERFGLAQLHQLRGRVIRSNHQAFCFLFTESKTEKTIERLRALKTAKNGFELSEFDLKLRGSGELAGQKQWGVSDLGMEAIKNIKMVEAARYEAETIASGAGAAGGLIKTHPLIAEKIAHRKDVHFE